MLGPFKEINVIKAFCAHYPLQRSNKAMFVWVALAGTLRLGSISGTWCVFPSLGHPQSDVGIRGPFSQVLQILGMLRPLKEVCLFGVFGPNFPTRSRFPI